MTFMINKNDIAEIIERMKEVARVKTDAELSRFLGLSSTTVSKWKAREKIPDKNLFAFLEKTKVNKSWLLTGEGEMYPQNKSLVIKGNHINGVANSNIAVRENIKIKLHPKNVSDDEDELLESYRSLPKELREVYLHRIKADAIEYRLRRNINE